MKDVTRILSGIEQGDPSAAEGLLPLVYQELRRLAAANMAVESPDQTLQATALVHEAYLRLVDVDEAQHWDSRGHFFAAAAQAMRRILVESAAWKKRLKRGGDVQRHSGELEKLTGRQNPPDVIAVDDALKDLADHDQLIAKLVELRYFGGLTLSEAAAALGISDRTSDRYWAYAKAWLYEALADSEMQASE